MTFILIYTALTQKEWPCKSVHIQASTAIFYTRQEWPVVEFFAEPGKGYGAARCLQDFSCTVTGLHFDPAASLYISRTLSIPVV